MKRLESFPSLVYADWAHLIVRFRTFSDIRDSIVRHQEEDSHLRNTHCASEPFDSPQSELVLTVLLSKSLPERCVVIRVEGISLGTDLCVVEAPKSSSR